MAFKTSLRFLMTLTRLLNAIHVFAGEMYTWTFDCYLLLMIHLWMLLMNVTYDSLMIHLWTFMLGKFMPPSVHLQAGE